jgi:hypothetical protein
VRACCEPCSDSRRDLGALLRQLEPLAALSLRLEHQVDAVSALLGQRIDQLRHVEEGIQDEGRRDELVPVMLGQEGGQHLDLDRRLFESLADLGREVGAVAQVAPAPHHRQVDAGAAALHHHGDDVDVGIAGGLHALRVQHPRQRLDLVAHAGRLLELEVLGVHQHLLFQVFQHLALAPAQELGRVVDVALVVFRRDQLDARAAAAADLVQQAGPRAVVEDAVLAGAQLEHLLQQLHRFLHRPGAREGTEVLVLLVQRAAVIGHARRVSAGDLQVGVRFIVAEQDVVARLERLDQVVFQDQRLGLAVRHRGLEARDLRHHHRDARARQILLEVARHAVLEVARLADVQDLVLGVEIAVHAGQAGQLGDGRQHLLAGRCAGTRAPFRVLADGGGHLFLHRLPAVRPGARRAFRLAFGLGPVLRGAYAPGRLGRHDRHGRAAGGHVGDVRLVYFRRRFRNSFGRRRERRLLI